MHFFAAVVAASQAGLALVANDIRLNSDTVADRVRGNRWVFRDHDAGRFMAEDVRVFHHHGSNATGVPEVNV